MVLPRFERLADNERARILDVAARVLADSQNSDASIVEVAEAAGLSRSAMYNYFDGRADLLAAVAEHAGRVASEALGPWTPVDDVTGFWGAFRAASTRLRALVHDRPELRSYLTLEGPTVDDPWLGALLDNAAALGLRTGSDRVATAALTAAVLGAIDQLELEQPGRLTDGDVESVIAALWRTAP